MPNSEPPISHFAAGPRLSAIMQRFDHFLHSYMPAKVVVVAIVVANVIVIIGASAPFVLYHGLGPQNFDDLNAGVVLPDPVTDANPDPASSGDRIAPDVPLNLSPSTRVTLLFSVGSQGVDPEQADRLRINDLASRGDDGLTDVMMVMLADPETGEVALVSIPRDLWLFSRGHRINASFNNYGTQGFVQDVANLLGLPIHHVVQINFLAFAELVDRIGGVALRVDRPLADLNSVLYVPSAGCWRFSGADALAYVRSRHTLTKSSSGTWRVDASASDFGRMERQQVLMAAAWESIRGPQIITKIPDLLAVAREGLKVDDDLGVQAARGLASAFSEVSAGNMEGYTVPTVGQRIGRAAAQVVAEEPARELMQRLRSWSPSSQEAAPPAPSPSGSSPQAVTAAGSGIVLAAADTLQIDPSCTLDVAEDLPSPHAPLAEIATSSNPPPSRGTADPPPPEPQPEESEGGDEPSEDPSGSEDSGVPLPGPTDGGDGEPSDEPSDGGSQSSIPLPDPFGTESDTDGGDDDGL